jgi:hypothetical protein
MAKTVEQLMQEFKIEGLDDNFVKALRTEVSEAHTALTQATTLKTEAEQAREAAKAERARIDQAILDMGDGSLNTTRLKAQNKALRAVVDSLKEDGLSIDLPDDIFKETPEPDPAKGGVSKELSNQFALMGQAIAAADIAARYVGIYGKPMPMDMQTLVSSAQRAGKTVQQFADQEFKLSDKMKEQSTAAETARTAQMKKEWEEEYKKAHPITNESPFMRPGASSRFTEMPKIKREDPSQTRTTAGLSDMEKLRRSQEHGRQMLAQSLQEN